VTYFRYSALYKCTYYYYYYLWYKRLVKKDNKLKRNPHISYDFCRLFHEEESL